MNSNTMLAQKHEIREGQSIELLKELHILTRDGKMNQDSRRKLKQIYHLYQFVEPLLTKIHLDHDSVTLVDHGAGKSYLGFILYDLYFKTLNNNSHIYGIDNREELVVKSRNLAQNLGFSGMSFLNLTVIDSIASDLLPKQIDIVTALHACDTATDDAIEFALTKKARFIVLAPCCQAEVAAVLKKQRNKMLNNNTLAELWRHPIHTREFGSHLTNVLRCLRLQASGYSVTVTELVGWEHSLKNELIIAKYNHCSQNFAAEKSSTFSHPLSSAMSASMERLKSLLTKFGLEDLASRFLPQQV